MSSYEKSAGAEPPDASAGDVDAGMLHDLVDHVGEQFGAGIELLGVEAGDGLTELALVHTFPATV